MRRHVQHPSILLCLLGASGVLQASDTPSTVQFDLVFPRNNSLIEPFYPSPVIFALHNFSAIRQNTIFWSWNITDAYDTEYKPPSIIASGKSRLDAIEKEISPDTLLMIEPVSQLRNNTVNSFRLRYTFGLTYACGNTTELPTGSPYITVRFEGAIVFGILGIVPDEDDGFIALARKGSCAIPIGSVGVQKRPSSNSEQDCQVLNPDIQPTKTCALPIDARVTERAEAVMNASAECPNRTWPDTTGLMGNCMSKASRKNDLETRGMILFMIAAFLLIRISP